MYSLKELLGIFCIHVLAGFDHKILHDVIASNDDMCTISFIFNLKKGSRTLF